MGSKSYPKTFFLSLFIFFSFGLLILVPCLKPKPDFDFRNIHSTVHKLDQSINEVLFQNPIWFDFVEKEFRGLKKIKAGLVNVEDPYSFNLSKSSLTETDDLVLMPEIETVFIDFNRVDNDMIKWEDLFPEWINEDEKRDPQPTCPKIPMPTRLENYRDLDVVVARIPCGKKGLKTKEGGIRDVFRLQVNLVVANLVVNSGSWVRTDLHRTVYVVFIGSSCGPMMEIFRCDDLLMHQGRYMIYKPEIKRLKQKILMPVGSCQVAPAFAETGKEVWKKFMSTSKQRKTNSTTQHPHQREAYVTVLHSSENYVCGAIALAQSLLQTNTKKDLVLLADINSITPASVKALISSGWKIKYIHRIKSPFARKGAYNEWNYSKLRIWQLIEYRKVIFIDSDFIVLKNIDHFFIYPQLSAAPNDKFMLNSGIMVIEPSLCLFEDFMMKKSYEVGSYNGGDQGFLNEVFSWWHRLPTRLNHLKIYEHNGDIKKHDGHDDEVLNDVYAIHYLGLKPWMCYKDYDCNWDMADHRIFASDAAHKKWWDVYEKMARELKGFCGLSEKMEEKIEKWRKIGRVSGSADEHWKIQVKDPRQHHYRL